MANAKKKKKVNKKAREGKICAACPCQGVVPKILAQKQ